MVATRKSLYNAATDGGAIGTHIMRGARLHSGLVFVWGWIMCLVAPTFAAGCQLRFGTVTTPDMFGFGFIDPSFSTPGVFDQELSFAVVYFGADDVFVVEVSGAPITAGEYQMFLSTMSV